MKRFILAFAGLLYLGTASSQGQTPVTEAEKQQIRQLLSTYEKDLRLIARPEAQPTEQNAGKRELLTLVEDKAIWVANDLDSAAAFAPVTMQQYVQELLPREFPDGVVTTLLMDKLQFGPVRQDKIRRYDYIEVRVPKSLTWQEESADSSEADGGEVDRTFPLSFFIKLNRTGGIEKAKLFAISKAGTAPKLPPLPPLIAWWGTLTPEWRSTLMKACKMPENPRESELENMLAIRALSIAKAPVTDLGPLAKFTDLQELNCTQTTIADLSPLSKLVLLEKLDVSRTQLTSLKGIENLRELTRLNASFNKLKELAPVAKLSKLEELNVSDNELTDLSPLAGLEMLRKLNFNNNLVTSLSPLKPLVNLEELRMMKSKLDDFNVLSNFPNLVVLDCYSTGIDNLEPIRSLTKLVNLNCGANPIATLDPIAGFNFIVELNISTTKINTLAGLRNFKQLEILDCSNTMIPELGPVHDIDGMRVLKCHLTKIDVRDKDRFKKKHPGCEITYY